MELQTTRTFPTKRFQMPIRLTGLKRHGHAETQSPSILPAKDPYDVELRFYLICKQHFTRTSYLFGLLFVVVTDMHSFCKSEIAYFNNIFISQ